MDPFAAGRPSKLRKSPSLSMQSFTTFFRKILLDRSSILMQVYKARTTKTQPPQSISIYTPYIPQNEKLNFKNNNNKKDEPFCQDQSLSIDTLG